MSVPIARFLSRLALPGAVFLLAPAAVPRAAPTPAATPLAAPYDLYETPRLADPDLLRWRPGAMRVLHQERLDGTTWMLLALPDGETVPDVAGERPRYVGRVRAGERVILAAPPEPGEPRLRSGRPVTLSPSGASVLVTAESDGGLARRGHGAWRAADLPLPVPRPRAAGPSPRFAAALERASKVRGDIPGLRSGADVATLVSAVSLASLEVHVRALSQKPSGLPDSRWWDPGTPGDASAIIAKQDYVRARLEAALGPGSVTLHGADIQNGDGETVRVYNIVARKPASVPGAGAGAFLLTAHLDAIGLRSDPGRLWDAGYSRGGDCDSTALGTDPDCAWDSARDPAPGANDNATGVAVLLEAARVLAATDFDFDLVLVAFTAEEIGLRGSAAYADSVAREGQEIFGVLNLDQIAYNALTNEVDVVADGSSEWLADWLVETGEQFVPNLSVEKKVEPFGRSDHASFWSRGIDAILVNEDTRVLYPQYHTFEDVWENTFPASGRPNSSLQLHLAAQLAIASVARFAVHQETPDLALPAGELEAAPVIGRDFVVGRVVRLTARVHNFGTSALDFAGVTTDSLTARVSFWLGDPDAGGVLLDDVTRKDFHAAGGVVAVEMLWDTTGQRPGFVEVFAKVEGLDSGYAQLEASPFNNVVSRSIFLESPESDGPGLLNLYAFPNPVRGTRDDLQLHYELTRDAGVEIDVFDLEGTLVGEFRAPADFVAEGNRAGPNTIDGRAFAWKAPVLESGVYVYVIRATGAGRSASDRGKFALVR